MYLVKKKGRDIDILKMGGTIIDDESFTEEELKEVERRLEIIAKNNMDMDVFSPKGTKITHTGERKGFEKDKELAEKYLDKDKIYTVEKTIPLDWITYVEIQEVPGVLFNSLNFKKVVN